MRKGSSSDALEMAAGSRSNKPNAHKAAIASLCRARVNGCQLCKGRCRASIRRTSAHISAFGRNRKQARRDCRSHAIASKPGMSRLVMHVGGIKRGDQDVYVEESDRPPPGLQFVSEPVHN